jgi:putative transposase
VNSIKSPKVLKTGNARLKKLLAEAMLDMKGLKVVVKGKP